MPNYTIDRWILNTKGGVTNTLSLVEEGITISTSNTVKDGTILRQKFESNPVEFGATVTFSLLVESITGEWMINQYGNSSTTLFSSPGLVSCTFVWSHYTPNPSFENSIQVYNNTKPSASITIKAAKLELGTEQTLAQKDSNGNWVMVEPVPNKALTLTKCQRYQIELFNNVSTQQDFICTCIAFDHTHMAGIIPLTTSLRDVYPIIYSDMSAENPYASFGITTSGYSSTIQVKEVNMHSNQQNALRCLFTVAVDNLVVGNAYQIVTYATNKHRFLIDANL